jgi:hypothetical protein
MFPKALGVLLIVGAAGLLVEMLATFLVTDFGEKISAFVVIPSAAAEILMIGYLLVIGVKAPKPAARMVAAA